MRALAPVILAVLSASRTARAETCAPRVALAGDAVLTSRIAERLHALGDPTDGGAEGQPCRAIRVELVAAADGGIAVTVHDDGDRTSRRVVSDDAIASAWIDSWARDELVAIEPPGLVGAASAGADQDATAAIVARAPAHRDPSWLDRVTWDAAYAHSWGEDGSSWNGGTVAVCARVGGACLGGRISGAYEGAYAVKATSAARSDLSALAIARWSFAAGPVAIAPELGLGVGRLGTSRVEPCVPPSKPCATANACPTTCTPTKIYVGDNASEATYRPRASAGMTLSVPIGHWLWIDGSAEVTASPWAHTAAFMTEPATASVKAAETALPGEPYGSVEVALGLRVATP